MGAIKRQQRLRHVPRSGTVKLVRLRAPKPKLPRKAGPHGDGWWQQGHNIPREYRSRWLKTSREVTREVRGTPGWSAVRLQNGQTSPMVVARHPGAPPRAPVLRSQMPEAPRQKVHVKWGENPPRLRRNQFEKERCDCARRPPHKPHREPKSVHLIPRMRTQHRSRPSHLLRRNLHVSVLYKEIVKLQKIVEAEAGFNDGGQEA